MRVGVWVLAAMISAATCGTGLAADSPSPEQLKKMYDDALVQLKSAQDRKNELAKENENLKAKTDELQKDLAVSQTQVQDLKRELAGTAEKNFYLRAYHAAWEDFLRRYPELVGRWNLFMENGVEPPDQMSLFGRTSG